MSRWLVVVIPLVVVLAFVPPVAKASPKCGFELDPASVRVLWTGFKTTERLGAQGEFKSLDRRGSLKASSLKRLFEAQTVRIDASVFESGNEARNVNLRDHFFQKMTTMKMEGRLTNVTEKDATLNLKLNGVQKKVPLELRSEKGEWVARGTLDVLNFSLSKALEALNQVCLELHRGKDGISKTWSEVEIEIRARVADTCTPVTKTGQEG